MLKILSLLDMFCYMFSFKQNFKKNIKIFLEADDSKNAFLGAGDGLTRP